MTETGQQPTDSYDYDAAGRVTSRSVDGQDFTLTWDVSSNLVRTVETTTGDTIWYLYNESGQRVAKINTTHDTATAYLGSTEVTDADTTTNADLGQDPDALEDDDYVTGTRFYTFGGSTIAVRDGGTGSLTDSLSLMLGDYQGSATVMMPVTVDSGGDMAAATTADVTNATSNAYLPYGDLRGTDNLTIDHGWLNQVVDNGANDTGLVYLNARYYDPAASRFISPDPLMDPMDPKTLDPYRYADNNPILFKDDSGLAPSCSGLTGAAYQMCSDYAQNTVQYGGSLKRVYDPNKAISKIHQGRRQQSIDAQWAKEQAQIIMGNSLSLGEAASAAAQGVGDFVTGAAHAIRDIGVGIYQSYIEMWKNPFGAAGKYYLNLLLSGGNPLGGAPAAINLVNTLIGEYGDGGIPQASGYGLTLIGLIILGAKGASTRAANTETAFTRFTVDSAGETTLHLRLGAGSIDVTEHAALRMAQRGISIESAEATLSQSPFAYYHDGVWKTGYYDTTTRVFVGTYNGEVKTVFANATPKYIANLKAARP